MKPLILFLTLLFPATCLALPRYVIAIHYEPHHYAGDVGGSLQRDLLYADFLMLCEMVNLANFQGTKLTIMFSAEAAEFMMLDRSRWSLPRIWAEQGHEISIHHHAAPSLKLDWDGYTDDLPSAIANRLLAGENEPATYQGTLDDLVNTVEAMGVPVKSGCFNDEVHKLNLPARIQNDMCSGYANYGPPATIAYSDSYDPVKGVNQYILTDGVHRWLAGTKLDPGDDEQLTGARLLEMQQIMLRMPENQVYGMVTHNLAVGKNDIMPQYINLLRFLHEHDPYAEQSRTLSGAIEEGVLPEKKTVIPWFNWQGDLE